MLALAIVAAMQGVAVPVPAAPIPPAARATHPPEGAMHGLIGIFDTVCNHAFPDESRLANIGKVPDTRELTPDELKVYLKGDPGHGWISSKNGSTIVITIEAPPFHTCAIRMLRTDGQIDERMWRSVIDAAEAADGGGFVAMEPQSLVRDEIHIAVQGDQKRFPDGSAEAFYLFRSSPVDPAKAPDYGIELRLVRQVVSAGERPPGQK